MKILAIGSRGQLGWELVKQEKHSNFEIRAVDLPELDITNIAQIENIFALFKPSIVINAAAYTNVDKAETDHGLAFGLIKNKLGINTKPWQESLKITIERIMSSSEGHFSDFLRNYQF